MAIEQVIGYVLLLGGWAAALFVAWKLGYFSLPELKREPKLRGSFVLIAFGLLSFIFLVVAPMGLLIYQLINTGSISPGASVDKGFFAWFSFGIYLLLPVVLLLIGYFFLGPKHLKHICFGPEPRSGVMRDLLVGWLTWPLAIVPVSLFHQALTWLSQYIDPHTTAEQLAIKQLKDSLELGPLFMLTAFAMVVLIPIFEELLFRGILQTWLRGWLGRFWGIVSCSVFFAFAHFSQEQGTTNFQLLGSLFVLSCFLGFVYERQRSLVAPIALHSLFNFLSVSAIFFTGGNQ